MFFYLPLYFCYVWKIFHPWSGHCVFDTSTAKFVAWTTCFLCFVSYSYTLMSVLTFMNISKFIKIIWPHWFPLFCIRVQKNTTYLLCQQVFLSCTVFSVLHLFSLLPNVLPFQWMLIWGGQSFATCHPFKAMHDCSFAVAFNFLTYRIFDPTSLFYHLRSPTFMCSSDVTYTLASSFPKVKLPAAGHLSCSYFELSRIESLSLSLPTLSMNAVFS